MTAITATPESLEQLDANRARVRRELNEMRRINAIFTHGKTAFIHAGYRESDFDRFAEAMRRNPDYGPEPFPEALISNKRDELRRLEKAATVGIRLLHVPIEYFSE